jgi:hypothetical protein
MNDKSEHLDRSTDIAVATISAVVFARVKSLLMDLALAVEHICTAVVD